MQIDGLIQKYYVLIVEKAKIYKSKGNIFNIEKSQNQLPMYLKDCNLDKLLLEVSQIQALDYLIFEVIFSSKIHLNFINSRSPKLAKKVISNIM